MIIDKVLVKKIIQPRPLDSHKGTFGRVLLIGGNYPYGGAIIMAASACVNSGAGLVTVATHKDNITALHSRLPESMAFDMAEKDRLTEQIAAADVILIGPGLAEDDLARQTFDLLWQSITAQQILVIDGSALNLLAKRKSAGWPSEQIILTPHQKEWERLSGLAISKQTEEATQTALAAFPKGTVLVAKSHQTKLYQNSKVGKICVGGPYQATGGMGDTLAGMIAGFVAQFHLDRFDVTAAAVFLHSYIAEQLSKQAYVVLPTRISTEIARVMKEMSD
ncbi:NAD(P)H-hydrate dehydratase [Streptococcus macacae]|uniref:ADP-dependent (S)-NAD(P)H-hydrate dehydratase n=1 Tax=Streptococcus macacae NCTC 11558 TaxID=764298 RepID=G5JVX9_9STRE|nr:NAD(P)H-hydrate dehydratase [Streptococcus macacae]EHJ53228.1 YjeF C-terminal domain protein [Streptococcus macacae NCTC 11558]SUN78971.1 carbohydrate kinase family protein [Streptococcus macacae NCTC 11558]